MDDVFIARQPILDDRQQVCAYEFLFRQGGSANHAEVIDVNHVSARMITNIFGNFGAENLTSGGTGFINVDRNLLMGEAVEIIPRENFVLEILESCRVDQFLIRRVDELREKGYRFALDDFEFTAEYVEKFTPLLKKVEYIKIEVPSINRERFPKQIELLKRFSVKLLAEKVETREEYEYCRDLGINYFQGYYFAKPQIMQQKSIEPSKLSIMNLVTLIRSDAENIKIVEAFRQSPQLTFLLLRFINSGAMFLRNRIESVQQAIVMIGMRQLLNWLMLLVYANPSKEHLGVYDAVFQTALFRAKLMENLFVAIEKNAVSRRSDTAFFVGVLSLVDVVFHSLKEDILTRLNVPQDIYEAVVNYDGLLGKLLWLVMVSEQDDYTLVQGALQEMNVSVEHYNQAKLSAYQWITDFISGI